MVEKVLISVFGWIIKINVRKNTLMDNMEIGKRLYELRNSKNLTQKQEAEILGVTDKAISKWECGEALPSVDLLLKISQLYNCSMEEILTGEKKKEETTTTKPSRDFNLAQLLLSVFGIIASAFSILFGFILSMATSIGTSFLTVMVFALVSATLYLVERYVCQGKDGTLRKVTQSLMLGSSMSLLINFAYLILASTSTFSFNGYDIKLDIFNVHVTAADIVCLYLFILILPTIFYLVGRLNNNRRLLQVSSNIIPPFTLWYFFFSSLTNNQGNSTTMIILLSISAISTIAMIFTIIYPKIILLDGCLFTGVSLFLLIPFPLFLTNEQSSPIGIIGFILSLGLLGFDIYLFLKYKKKKEA